MKVAYASEKVSLLLQGVLSHKTTISNLIFDIITEENNGKLQARWAWGSLFIFQILRHADHKYAGIFFLLSVHANT